MTRVTRAAQVLAQQILTHWEDAQITNPDEPDGLGVHRQLLIEEPAGKPVFEVLLPIAQHDPRIDKLELKDDALTITFVAGTAADDRTPFAIDEVLAVQNTPETNETGPSGPAQAADGPVPQDPPKKRTAKKTAAKPQEKS